MISKKNTRKKAAQKTVGFTAKVKNAIIFLITRSNVIERVKEGEKKQYPE